MKQFKLYILMLLVYGVTFYGCNTGSTSQDENNTLKIVYTDWSESIAITYLSKVLLEDEMEYEVELKLSSVDDVYAALANGEAHVFADAWLPETHRSYLESYPESIDHLGIIYPDARTGLIVPQFSALQSISDIKGSSITKINGIEAEAGVMIQATQAIEKYGLADIELVDATEGDMTKMFSESYLRREEVVITGWEPHWLFERFDVRFLEDPKGVFGDNENIVALGCRNLSSTHPRVYRFFERMQLSENQFNRLIYFVNQYEDPEMGVREWINKNEYVVNQWVKGLKPERKKIM
jgi:glycine betaine/proline transport system substrate-binding protein